MLNRDIYQTDPSTRKLINEGVANVNDDRTDHALAVLRYELETFVCDGQYENGMAHVLEAYLKNIDQPQQPGVWISGFYGSGKSHLVKMLRALWVDTRFPDGAVARDIANLPQSVRDQLRELSTQAKRHGGLHAASGTLGASSSDKSVRLALLSIIFKSAGLPPQYPLARFMMWLRAEGILDAVRAHVEQNGGDWAEELDNFYVAEGLHAALVATKPNLFPSHDACVLTLNNLYPYVQDVSNDEMIKAIRQALSQGTRFPLTLVVLDEVQQYIGSDGQRSIDVQETVEACCKMIGGKLLFVGTGQTAVTGTPNLKKLEGRFTVRVELSDADVDAVIRKVILAKTPDAKKPIEQIMQTNIGEISRHLSSTSIAHRQDDVVAFPQDYPILPVRRRFWESTLRVLDQTGTDSQLRNQLSMVHKVIQANLDAPLGAVVPADAIYFDSADKLLQTRVLPRKVHEKTLVWAKGTADDKLMARACGLVFLVGKLAASNKEIGIHCTVDTLADLLVDDLTQGSSALRAKLPALLDACELLMKVGDEYRIQTEESAAWTDEFIAQRSALANEAHRVDAERDERVRRKVQDALNKIALSQGTSKVSRTLSATFDAALSADANRRLCVWVRDGWSVDENSVRADARQAGSESPTVFVFVPKRNADDFRNAVIDYKAASATLDKKGVQTSPEGGEARAAMETTRQLADTRLRDLLDEMFTHARVFQGGGTETEASLLHEKLGEAATHALSRLYPQFHLADHVGWAKVLERAQKGSPDALAVLGFTDDPAKHPVCKQVLAFIAGGKRGADVRKQFEGPPYGWSGDAIDGALQVLLVGGVLRATDDHGQPVKATDLERKAVGRTTFKVESATVTTSQRIQLRQLFTKLEVQAKQNEESSGVGEFLGRLEALAKKAGGAPPMPAPPDTTLLDEIRLTSGNEQLLALVNAKDALTQAIDTWQDVAQRIEKRWPAWETLRNLAGHVAPGSDADVLVAQMQTIASQRQLLDEPDPVHPLLSSLTQLLRDALNDLHSQYQKRHQEGYARLDTDSAWEQVDPEQQALLLEEHHLRVQDAPRVDLGTTQDVLATLRQMSLSAFADRVAAIDGRVSAMLAKAALLMEPKAQIVTVPRQTLKTHDDIDAWMNAVRKQLEQALQQGPVVIK